MFDPELVWEFKMVERVRFGNSVVDTLSDVVGWFDADSASVITNQGVRDAGRLD